MSVFLNNYSTNEYDDYGKLQSSGEGVSTLTWSRMQKLLQESRNSGNGNFGLPYGVTSTYSLVYTGNGNGARYIGGVLDAEGSVHFVPSGAAVGQKVSLDGVVSTYTLVYTGGGYQGGVLDIYGNIHFIPTDSIIGQKVSPSGVVSTYSLLISGYAGGVVDSNGNIQLIPFSSSVGQTISSGGVVTTYSLVYTRSINAYSGGVLNPVTGDVYFIPNDAAVGQKISSSGVVSTFTLLYSNLNNTYNLGIFKGGILSMKGDIHFVPSAAPVGQKININGIVSTYQLAYTTSVNGWAGGCLAPDGSIYFCPYGIPTGFSQVIKYDGTPGNNHGMSYILSGGYLGMVCNSNGEAHLAPYLSTIGQKISFNQYFSFSKAICLSPYFNKF